MWPMLAMMGAQASASAFSASSQASSMEDASTDSYWNARAQAGEQMNSQREAQEWEERMSNTAFQRSSADMEKAGINPIAGFSPASTPSSGPISGAQPQLFPTQSPIAAGVGGFVSGAKDALNLMQSIRESNSRIQLNQENAATSTSTGYLNTQKGNVLKQDEKLLEGQNYLLDNRLNVERQFPNVGGALDALSARGINASSAGSIMSGAAQLMAE